jgi:MFS family permease
MVDGNSTTRLISSRAGRFSAWRPLALRDYRLLFFGQGISLLGDQLYLVALPWLVLQMTGSTLVLGTILLAGSVPRMIFLLVGGAASDWLSPHRLMLVSNTLRSAVCAILTLLVVFKAISFWHLAVLAAAFGTLDAFFGPAVRSFIPSVVDTENLVAANSLMQSVEMLSKFLGPSVAGLVVATAGLGAAFGADTLSFVFVTCCLLVMTTKTVRPDRDAKIARAGLLQSIREGLRYTFREPSLRSLIIVASIIEFAFAGPLTVGLASLANFRFAGGSKAFGVMLSTLGGGFLLGTVLANTLKKARLGLVFFFSTLILSVTLTLLGFAPNLLAACAALVVIATVGGIMQVLNTVYLQQRSEPNMRGRVMSVVLLSAFGLTPFSYLAAGALNKIDLKLVFIINGGLVLAAALLCLAQLREFDAPLLGKATIGES